MDNYLRLESKIERIFLLNNCVNILYWDLIKNTPTGSKDYRKQEIKNLALMAYELLSSKDIEQLINNSESEREFLDPWQYKNLTLIKNRFLEASSIGKQLQENYLYATALCEENWLYAKKTDNFNYLLPYLEKVLDYTQQIAEAKAKIYNTTPYHALCLKYIPDLSMLEIKNSFKILKQGLTNILMEAQAYQSQEDYIPINLAVPINDQKDFCFDLIEMFGFDYSKGRVDEGAHPFCGGAPNDIRLLTKFDSNNILNSILSIIHECGHALYEQSLPTKYQNQPVGKANAMIVHESQSLFLEMQFARSEEFMEYISKQFHNKLGLKGEQYSAENLYKEVTRIKNTPIRLNADEISYSLHILIRFEIEEALIAGDLALKDLPDYWNEMMLKYLNIKIRSISEGCLQDIHWPKGMFGYFPAYTLGAIIAAMLHKNYNLITDSKIENIDQRILSVNNYLDNNIRNFGSLKSVNDLIHDSTVHKSICTKTYLEYLKQKYIPNDH